MVIRNSVIISLNILGVNKIDVGYCFLSNIMVLNAMGPTDLEYSELV